MEGQVVAALAVALLEATRSHDRPGEVLEEEDLSVSLPRRLGLSGVIETQIQRYEGAVKAGRRLPLDEFISLLKLVLRRPDAEAILREAGKRVATRQFEKVPKFYVGFVRATPRALGFVFVARGARKLLRNITGTNHVDVRGRPLNAQLHQPPTAMLEPAGTACALYGAAIEEIVSLYTGKKARVSHSRCVINGGSVCEWKVDV
jgi:predicted hydrocarbon binding protein